MSEQGKVGAAKQKKDRRLGLASDPGWEQTTVYLKVDTKIEVRKKLLEDKTSLSALINGLLEEWLER